jgi:hypothetical protein
MEDVKFVQDWILRLYVPNNVTDGKSLDILVFRLRIQAVSSPHSLMRLTSRTLLLK